MATTTFSAGDSNIPPSDLRIKRNLSSYVTEASKFTADFRHSWIQASNTISRGVSFSMSWLSFPRCWCYFQVDPFHVTARQSSVASWIVHPKEHADTLIFFPTFFSHFFIRLSLMKVPGKNLVDDTWGTYPVQKAFSPCGPLHMYPVVLCHTPAHMMILLQVSLGIRVTLLWSTEVTIS